jgi:membrane-associated HD superfamily phosphohydrolase
MSPQEYSRKIIDHVNRGVETGRKQGLPQSVIDFIQEHHGASVMTFFYHQALEEANNTGSSESVNKADFTYPGPKPHTREIAIVMLADAIEAASRSLQEPSYVKLETLVKKIIFNKLNEGELDNCDLTMQDLSRIQQAFLRVLNGIFHTRLEYPEKDEIKKLESQIRQNNEHN